MVSDIGTADARPLPGGGLIAAERGLLLVCGGADDVTDDLLAALRETVAAGGDGRMLVRRTAQVLAASMSAEGVDCAAAGPTEGALAVLASGAAVVAVTMESGDATTLDARGALTFTDRLIPGPVDSVELRLPDAGEPDPRLRLNSGVIPGGGVRCGWSHGDDAGTGEAPPAGAARPAAPVEHPAPAVEDLSVPVARSTPEPAAEPAGEPAAAPEPGPAEEPAAPVAMPWNARPAPDRDNESAPPGAVPPPPAAAPQPPPPPAPPEPSTPSTAPQPPVPQDQPGPGVPPPGPGYPPGPYGAPAPPGPPGYPPPGPYAPPPPPGRPGPPGPPPGADPYAAQQPPSGPPASAQPFESVLLTSAQGQPAPPEPEVTEEPEPDPRPLISGVDCKNGHFNDPNSHYCGVCGISMVQRTLIAKQKPRPPLGVLLFDDGKTLRLDTDYIIGRGPEGSEEVTSGQARPARLADSDGTISRRHAHVALDGWNVLVIDLGSSNGTRVEAPNGQGFQFIPPGQPVQLQPGTRVFIGSQRSFEFESHRRI